METITQYAVKLLSIPIVAFIIWLTIYKGFPEWIKELKNQSLKQLISLLFTRKNLSWAVLFVFFFVYSNFVNFPIILLNFLITTIAIIFYYSFKKKDYQFIVAVSGAVIAAASAFFAFVSSEDTTKRLDQYIISSNKPNVIITEKYTNDGRSVILWNCGPGTAYKLNVEVHLSFRIRNVDTGNLWFTDVLDFAEELETKDQERMSSNYFRSSKPMRDSRNPPSILPQGKDYGYETSPLQHTTMSGVFIIIRYNDAIGNQYYSVWNGWEWQFGKGNGNNIKLGKYEPVNIQSFVTLFWNAIVTTMCEASPVWERPNSFKEWQRHTQQRLFIYKRYLIKEAEYLKKNGYGNIPAFFEELDKKLIEKFNYELNYPEGEP